jgi:hypothetical protein
MYDAVSIYHVMKAEQQAMLAELAEIEHIRSLPRRISSRPRRPANAVLRIPWLSRPATRTRSARLTD